MLNSPTINFSDSIILRLSVLFLFLLSSAVQAQTPRSPEDYLKRGVARYDKRDYDGAIADFDRSLALNPGLETKIDRYIKDKRAHAIKE